MRSEIWCIIHASIHAVTLTKNQPLLKFMSTQSFQEGNCNPDKLCEQRGSVSQATNSQNGNCPGKPSISFIVCYNGGLSQVTLKMESLRTPKWGLPNFFQKKIRQAKKLTFSQLKGLFINVWDHLFLKAVGISCRKQLSKTQMSGIRTCTWDQDAGLIQWLEEPDRSRLQPASLKSEVLIKAEHNSGNHANLFAVLHGLQHCTLFTDSLTICLSYQFYITVTDITDRCLNL